MTDKENSRDIVLSMLLEIIEGDKYSHTVLSQTLKKHQSLEKQERAFITRLCTGTVKRYLTLDYIINQFASLPVQKMKPLIRNLLRMSVYQILYMDKIPVSAVCNEAVNIAKKHSFTRLSGFVNGVLRNIARNTENMKYPDKKREPEKYLEITYSVPEWLAKLIINQYGFKVAEAMFDASLKEKETTIRCNLKKVTPDELQKLLCEEGVTVLQNEYLPYAFKIKDFDYLEKLKTFQSGCFTVQDVSSMLVCEAAGIRNGDFVADVCAAPGGKALHASQAAAFVSARDLTEYKVNLMKENIDRLGITNVETKVWDATAFDETLAGRADVVIADLPCSGLGVLGKKSDIKYKLTEKQLEELAQLQKKILSVVKDYVRPGGILIYSTCTVNQKENTTVRDWFLKNHSEFEAENLDPFLPEALHSKETKAGYLQLIQGIHNTDGFFLSRLRRKA